MAQVHGLGPSRRPSGTVLHSSREPGLRRPYSDFTDRLRRLINCRINIIIIIIIIICGELYYVGHDLTYIA